MAKSNGTSRPEVSVVVPIYNVEEYLAECLDSILQQPGVEFEVVCIDDRGTDRSMEILQEYLERDSRIRLVSHAENRGLSAARNTGIENAEGDYIVLLDSDDLLNPDCLKLQVEAIRRDQADMVYFHTDLLWERFPGDPSPTVSSIPAEFVLFNQELRRTNLLNYPALLHATSSWSYIYSRDFLLRLNIRYDEELKRWEDRAFWTRVARLAESVSIVPIAVRRYRQRTMSITKAERNEEDLRMMMQQFNIILDEFELFQKKYQESDTLLHTKYLHSYLAFRVTSWYINSAARIEDRQVQEAVLQRAVDLFRRLDWPHVDLRAVKHFTRRLEIDLGKTVLLSGLLKNGSIDKVLQFLDTPRLPLDDLLEAEAALDGQYHLPRKRFEYADFDTQSADSPDRDHAETEAWMKDINLVIHLGFRKTGTTYIQRAFDQNRKRLLRAGVLFPNAGLDRTDSRGGRPGACAGHLGFLRLLRNPEQERGLWPEVLQEIGKHEVKTIFISAENFLHEYQSIDLEKLRKTFSGFKQLSFIVSLRRPDAWIESFYKEQVTGGWAGEKRDFDSFVRENWDQMDYAERLDPWFQEFGFEAFDAISVDAHNDQLDGVKAVLRILRKRTGAGPEPDSVARWDKLTDVEAYSSVKTELVEAIRLLNVAKKPSVAYRREVSWLIEKWSDTDGLYDATLMDPQMQSSIQTEMGPRLAGLLGRFGLEDPLAGAERPADGQAHDTTPATPPPVSSKIMEDVVQMVRTLPSNDSIQGFFKRFRNKSMQKAQKPLVSAREGLVAALILRPVLAMWNMISRDGKEKLRSRAKAVFGNGYVDRIVKLARRANPGH